MHCVSSFCPQKLCSLTVFWAKGFALTVRAFWCAEELRWVEMNFFQCSDEMKPVEKNLLRWHVRRDGMRWEEVRWGDMRCDVIRWFEMRWSVDCEVQVWSVKCSEKCSVKCEENVRLMLRANVVARRSRSREATAQQVRTKYARTAHGARKFYRWKRSYHQI